MDIGKIGRTLDLTYTIKKAQWTGEDIRGDANGYKYADGREDGSTAEPLWDPNQDDCAIWFDNTQNDADNDGLTYWEETNPIVDLNPSVTGVQGSSPTTPSLILEIDYMVGWGPSNVILQEARDAFSEAGIELFWVIDQANLPIKDTFKDTANGINFVVGQRNYLQSTRNPNYVDYLHVIFAKQETEWLINGEAVMAIFEPNSGINDASRSGVMIYSYVMSTISELVTTGQVTYEQYRAFVLIHEIGHALGCAHEATTAQYTASVDDSTELGGYHGHDVKNIYNIMVDPPTVEAVLGGSNSNSLLGNHGTGPRFSIESRGQINLRNKLSVETGYLVLSKYV
jgi:hypothetical protein